MFRTQLSYNIVFHLNLINNKVLQFNLAVKFTGKFEWIQF